MWFFLSIFFYLVEIYLLQKLKFWKSNILLRKYVFCFCFFWKTIWKLENLLALPKIPKWIENTSHMNIRARWRTKGIPKILQKRFWTTWTNKNSFEKKSWPLSEITIKRGGHYFWKITYTTMILSHNFITTFQSSNNPLFEFHFWNIELFWSCESYI